LVGYIMRKTSDKSLCYEDVRAVLDAELDFLESKGIAEQKETFDQFGAPEKSTKMPKEPPAGDKVTIK